MNDQVRQPQADGQMEMKEHGDGWKHWWWMILCCLPMIAIVVLAILGVIGSR